MSCEGESRCCGNNRKKKKEETANEGSERPGLRIDVTGLSEKLGVLVIPTVAAIGEGKKELIKTASEEVTPNHIHYNERNDLEVEKIIHLLKGSNVKAGVPLRTLALWLLIGNELIEETLRKIIEKEGNQL